MKQKVEALGVAFNLIGGLLAYVSDGNPAKAGIFIFIIGLLMVAGGDAFRSVFDWMLKKDKQR